MIKRKKREIGRETGVGWGGREDSRSEELIGERYSKVPDECSLKAMVGLLKRE